MDDVNVTPDEHIELKAIKGIWPDSGRLIWVVFYLLRRLK